MPLTLITVLAIGFVMGAAIRQLIFVVDFSRPTPFPVQPVTVRIQSPESVSATRQALIRFVFDEEALPEALPTDDGGGMYTVRMQEGLESHARLVSPSAPNGRLALYHAGHAGYGEPDRVVVDELVARGFAVLVFDLPLVGVNAQIIAVDLPNGPVTISRHDHMAYLDPGTDGSPIRYFVEPVVVMLNEFGEQYSDVTMIGLSGGGWATTLVAAIDTRIDRSYPAAGTLPFAVQFAEEGRWGDWEQTEPGLYAIADYVDLYVLGAHERRQMQVLNEFDPCCFYGDYRSIYEAQVQAAIQSTGGGSFDVFMDSNNRQHSIGPGALEAIVADIDRFPAD